MTSSYMHKQNSLILPQSKKIHSPFIHRKLHLSAPLLKLSVVGWMERNVIVPIRRTSSSRILLPKWHNKANISEEAKYPWELRSRLLVWMQYWTVFCCTEWMKYTDKGVAVVMADEVTAVPEGKCYDEAMKMWHSINTNIISLLDHLSWKKKRKKC